MPPLSAAIDENKRKYFILQIHISPPCIPFSCGIRDRGIYPQKKRSKTIRDLSIINGDYQFYTSNSSIKDYIIPSQSLRHFVPPPLWLRHTPQCYGARQGRSLKMFEMHFSPLPLCCRKGILGECPQDEGVNPYSQKSYAIFFTPSPQELPFLRSLPYIFLHDTPQCYGTRQGRRTNTIRLIR